MTNTKQTAGIGILAFVTGLAAGAWAAFAAKKNEPSGLTFIFDETHGSENEGLEGENVTPDTTTLIDSLEGIEVLGTHAQLFKVRVLGLERAKAVAMWGTKGVNHNEPTKFKRLADLTIEHLFNIKNNSEHVTDDERAIIDSILEDREASAAVE